MYSSEAENYINHKGINEGRVVLHSDLNNFFASVECLKHKSLKAYPVAVCGSVDERHGIVLAKNNIAKSYGIKTGQVIWEAKKMCPDLVVLEPNYEDYGKYSEIIRDIYSDFSDKIEPFGLDEAWIELTGGVGINSLYDGVAAANKIRKMVFENTGLTVSVGVSDNKLFSKLASDYKKPDAVTLFGPDEYVKYISPLFVGEMIFVGRSSQKRLKSFALERIGDIASSDKELIHKILGKNGIGVYFGACGYDKSEVLNVETPDIIKSIGNSVTPPRDLNGYEDVKIMVYALCDKVCSRLRKAELRAGVVQIHLRDTNLDTTERQCKIYPTDNQNILAEEVMKLYIENFSKDTKFRSIGVRTSGLIKKDEMVQASIFSVSCIQEEKMRSIDATVDKLRKVYGNGIIRKGLLDSDKSLYSHIYSQKYVIQPFKSH